MKCPKCNNEVVQIVYGMPSYDLFQLAEKKEVYLGGCEITIGEEMPSYHCYECNEDFKNSEVEETDN